MGKGVLYTRRETLVSPKNITRQREQSMRNSNSKASKQKGQRTKEFIYMLRKSFLRRLFSVLSSSEKSITAITLLLLVSSYIVFFFFYRPPLPAPSPEDESCALPIGWTIVSIFTGNKSSSSYLTPTNLTLPLNASFSSTDCFPSHCISPECSHQVPL